MASNAVQLGLGALAAAAVGVAVIAFVPGPEPAMEEAAEGAGLATDVAPVVAETADATAPDVDEAQAEVAVAEDAAPIVPRIDQLVMAPDGFGTVSGRGDVDQVIAVLVAGAPVSRTRTDGNGNFAAVLALDPSPEPRRLTLLADPEGAQIPSEGQFFVQPILALVAEAPEPTEQEPDLVVGAITPLEEATADRATDPVDDDAVAEADSEVIVEEQPAAVVEAMPEPAQETAIEEPAQEIAAAEAPAAAPVEEQPEVETAEVEPAPAVSDPVVQDEDPALTTDTPTIIVADGDGVRIVQDDRAPEVMSAIALDTITYDPVGEVTLAGRAVGEGFVRVYVDNRPVTTSRIKDGGWQTDLPEVDTGVYTLRIDEVDVDGAVISRIETPFKREEPAAVAAVMAEDTAKEGFDVAVRTVQPGATLWAIAREEMGEGIMYVAVYEANKDLIKDPDLIFPGQVFRIPELDQ